MNTGRLGWPIWIGVVVRDLARQHRFYTSLLEFPEAASGPDFVRLDAGQGQSLELIEVSNRPEYGEPRFQVAFAVDDVEQAYDQLRRRGVEPIMDIVKGGDSPWGYFRDPEGRFFAIKEQPGGDLRHSRGLSDAAPRLLEWPSWIGVVVERLETQRLFWGALLGLPEAAAGPDFVHFDLGRGRSFELIERSGEPEYDRLRFQVGFAVRNIERARRELLSRGVEPVTDVIRGEESSWAYFRDPEGNVFEITERPGD